MAIEQKPPMERHFQTGIQTILVALCGWMAFTVHTSTVNIAELTVKIESLQHRVGELQSKSSDRYTASDATKDIGIITMQLNDFRVRIRRVENDFIKFNSGNN